MRVRSEWRGAIVLAAILLALVGTHYVFVFLPLRDELRETRVPKSNELPTHPEIAPEVVRRLGWLKLANDRESAFTRFAPDRPAGVTRVCTFGSSFTFGAEVDGHSDYPTLLAGAFRRLGMGTVEVVNFGVGGYGFHQSYQLWEHVYERYGCDFTLLFDGRWFPERDTVFNYDPNKVPYWIHARFVLRGDGLELIDVPGRTHSERFDAYYSYLPRWRFLRYDREPPLALRSLRPRSSPPTNPFYYDGAEAEEEAHRTYRALLERMVATGETIVLGSFSELDVATGRSVDAPNLHVFQLEQHRAFPYAAQFSHQGAWGNELVARAFLAQLVEGAAATVPVLETHDLDPAAHPASRRAARQAARLPLAGYASVAVHLGDAPVGRFTSVDAGRRVTLAEAGTTALLAIKGPEQSLAAACFLPVDRALEDGQAIAWETTVQDETPPLGPVRLLAPGVNVAVLNVEGLEFDQRRLRLTQGTNRTGPVSLLLEGEPILRGEWNGRVRSRAELHPVREACRRLRATRGGWVNPAHLPPRGSLELVLRPKEGPPTRAPFAAWTLTDFDLPRPGEALPGRLQRPPR